MLKVYLGFLLIFLTFSSAPKCSFQYNILALTWPGEFCSNTKCVRKWNQMWNNRDLTIHGYWPSGPGCINYQCYVETSGISQDLLSGISAQLQQHWPQFKSGFDIYQHQWNKHGTCYLDILRQNSAGGDDKTIYKQYFSSTIDKLKPYLGKLTKETYETKSDLASALGIPQNTFKANCGKDDELDEIRICYSLRTGDQKEKLFPCPKDVKGNCPFPITLRVYESIQQSKQDL